MTFSAESSIMTASESNIDEQKKKLRGLIPRANYTNERPSFVGEVTANFCG
jgi:hypothetical protein